jgi:hypothetical protein
MLQASFSIIEQEETSGVGAFKTREKRYRVLIKLTDITKSVEAQRLESTGFYYDKNDAENLGEKLCQAINQKPQV